MPMGSRGCAGMLPARRMAWYRTFIKSQVASVHLADMDLRDASYVTTCDYSVIKITRTDTTSLTYRKAGLGGEPYKGETPPNLPVLTS